MRRPWAYHACFLLSQALLLYLLAAAGYAATHSPSTPTTTVVTATVLSDLCDASPVALSLGLASSPGSTLFTLSGLVATLFTAPSSPAALELTSGNDVALDASGRVVTPTAALAVRYNPPSLAALLSATLNRSATARVHVAASADAVISLLPMLKFRASLSASGGLLPPPHGAPSPSHPPQTPSLPLISLTPTRFDATRLFAAGEARLSSRWAIGGAVRLARPLPDLSVSVCAGGAPTAFVSVSNSSTGEVTASVHANVSTTRGATNLLHDAARPGGARVTIGCAPLLSTCKLQRLLNDVTASAGVALPSGVQYSRPASSTAPTCSPAATPTPALASGAGGAVGAVYSVLAGRAAATLTSAEWAHSAEPLTLALSSRATFTHEGRTPPLDVLSPTAPVMPRVALSAHVGGEPTATLSAAAVPSSLCATQPLGIAPPTCSVALTVNTTVVNSTAFSSLTRGLLSGGGGFAASVAVDGLGVGAGAPCSLLGHLLDAGNASWGARVAPASLGGKVVDLFRSKDATAQEHVAHGLLLVALSTSFTVPNVFWPFTEVDVGAVDAWLLVCGDGGGSCLPACGVQLAVKDHHSVLSHTFRPTATLTFDKQSDFWARGVLFGSLLQSPSPLHLRLNGTHRGFGIDLRWDVAPSRPTSPLLSVWVTCGPPTLHASVFNGLPVALDVTGVFVTINNLTLRLSALETTLSPSPLLAGGQPPPGAMATASVPLPALETYVLSANASVDTQAKFAPWFSVWVPPATGACGARRRLARTPAPGAGEADWEVRWSVAPHPASVAIVVVYSVAQVAGCAAYGVWCWRRRRRAHAHVPDVGHPVELDRLLTE